jgi:hypothetical protein
LEAALAAFSAAVAAVDAASDAATLASEATASTAAEAASVAAEAVSAAAEAAVSAAEAAGAGTGGGVEEDWLSWLQALRPAIAASNVTRSNDFFITNSSNNGYEMLKESREVATRQAPALNAPAVQGFPLKLKL